MEQKWNCLLHLELTDLHDKRAKSTQQGKGSLLSTFCWENRVNVQKSKIKPFISHYSQLSTQGELKIPERLKSVSLAKASTENTSIEWFGKECFGNDPNCANNKNRNWKTDPINFYTTKDTIKLWQCLHSIYEGMGSMVITGEKLLKTYNITNRTGENICKLYT